MQQGIKKVFSFLCLACCQQRKTLNCGFDTPGALLFYVVLLDCLMMVSIPQDLN